MTWTLLGMWSEQAALSPLPPQPKQGRETLEESSIDNTPTAMLHKVRVKGLLHLRPFLPPMGTAAATALRPGWIAALRPLPPRVRPQRVRLPRDGSTKPLRPTEPLALKRLHHWPSSAFAAPRPSGFPATAAGA